jgi:hypothetical protein
MKIENSVAIVLGNAIELENQEESATLNSLIQVINSVSFVHQIIFIASDFIAQLLENFEGGDLNIVIVQVPRTRGALATLCLGLNEIAIDKHLLVLPVNCLASRDSLELFAIELSSSNYEAGVLAINSSNPMYSYARMTRSRKVIELVEKQAVGTLALSGHFYFRNVETFLSCATWTFKNNVNTNERFYIAPALNYFIASGKGIKLSLLDLKSYTRFD